MRSMQIAVQRMRDDEARLVYLFTASLLSTITSMGFLIQTWKMDQAPGHVGGSDEWVLTGIYIVLTIGALIYLRWLSLRYSLDEVGGHATQTLRASEYVQCARAARNAASAKPQGSAGASTQLSAATTQVASPHHR